MSEQEHLSALRRCARVRVGPDEVKIWLVAQLPFQVVSALVLLGSLLMEVILIAYALETASQGAWSIVVIVTLWLAGVLLMVRHRHRAIRQSPSLCLSQTRLSLPSQEIQLSDVESVRLVERHTYALVEVVSKGTSHGIRLRRPAQGPPLVGLIKERC